MGAKGHFVNLVWSTGILCFLLVDVLHVYWKNWVRKFSNESSGRKLSEKMWSNYLNAPGRGPEQQSLPSGQPLKSKTKLNQWQICFAVPFWSDLCFLGVYHPVIKPKSFFGVFFILFFIWCAHIHSKYAFFLNTTTILYRNLCSFNVRMHSGLRSCHGIENKLRPFEVVILYIWAFVSKIRQNFKTKMEIF